MHRAAKAYMTTKVTTTSQGDILLMLYDAAIKNLKQAKVKIGEKDYAGKGILISKAMDIISELSESLNADKGGSLAENLHNIYFYCTTKLLQANLKMNTDMLDEVIKILDGIKSAFAEIIPRTTGPAAVTPFAPKTPEPESRAEPKTADSSYPPVGALHPGMIQPPAAPPKAAPIPTTPAPEAARPSAAEPSASNASPKKTATVTPLHGKTGGPTPIRRAVAAYGNAR